MVKDTWRVIEFLARNGASNCQELLYKMAIKWRIVGSFVANPTLPRNLPIGPSSHAMVSLKSRNSQFSAFAALATSELENASAQGPSEANKEAVADADSSTRFSNIWEKWELQVSRLKQQMGQLVLG